MEPVPDIQLPRLPDEIHIQIMIDNMPLDDLLAYASSGAVRPGFYRYHKAQIWKALYLRDISPLPVHYGMVVVV